MSKQIWRPGNMLYPVPAVLVSVADSAGNDNLITIAWTGTVCSDPAMTYISVRKERYSHHMLKENKEFVINLVSKEICRAADFCGVRSGCDLDKFEATGLTREKASTVNVPLVKESPVNIECKVTQVLELGSHDMFLAKVTAVQVDESLLDEKGKLDLNKAHLVAYSHGEYQTFDNILGTFGYSVKKKDKKEKKKH
ncbi:flavin reductase family protein [Firmicutes bacterium AF25-13AC]|jgi:flavin reductase (DIM6/NTAB) family NADH-FMN oxidoreductase RutF|uniref:Flavin reductase family protein n=1 Tax=Anthropogastromicrobium aceti TaxID=2981768 RepID=A0AAE3E0Y0_9FIRM|nr:flavin reductase family protein [Anthropogastromicrobium aceti]MBS5027770.1 flavin reductase family protein [Clostridiales bacterium]MCC2220188.1 flavin reductase family protein [Anthropogastromicrobium aceti]RHQ58876.1 flavin reductase family protein [Firmicutes bacterium AF25-13AC]